MPSMKLGGQNRRIHEKVHCCSVSMPSMKLGGQNIWVKFSFTLKWCFNAQHEAGGAKQTWGNKLHR